MRALTLLVAAVSVLTGPAPCSADTAEEAIASTCAVVDIDSIGVEPLQAIKTTAGIDWWLELEAELLVCGADQTVTGIGRHQRLLRVYQELDSSRLYLADGLRRDRLAQLGGELIARGGRSAVLSLDPETVTQWQLQESEPDPAGRLYQLRPLLPELADTVIVSQLANREQPPLIDTTKALPELLDEIDGERWFADLTTLAGYNRWSYGSEIDNARDWLVTQLEALPGVTVTTPSFVLTPATGYNVVATLPGLTRPDDWYLIGGHYDSTSRTNPSLAAPGAEDNASGCAGVLELARIITAHPPAGTVLFICYSGEEQGLYGSNNHAAGLVDSGDDVKVKAMINMDMIGYTGDAELDCLLESGLAWQTLVDTMSAAASQYTTLSISISWSPSGSDHVPYLNSDMQAVLTIENDWDQYPYYHSANDTPDKITIDMGRQILRMNLATVAELAGVDANQIFDDGFELGDLSAWSQAVGTPATRVRRPGYPGRRP